VTLLDRIAVVKGSAVAIAICLPVTIVANVIHDENPDSALLPLLFVLVAAGFGVGGFVAGRARADAPFSNGAFAALTAFLVIQGIAVVVRVAGDEPIRVGAIVGAALIAYAAGIIGAALARRKATSP
jgi:putative membrane protein (TIGR04086 family)